jgi:rifampin ADP-ribosylating transferase
MQGMELENAGERLNAKALYTQAWEQAANPFEAFTAAHYLARIQQTPSDSLKWNLLALELAQKVEDPDISECFPSLYLNIAKSYDVNEQPDIAQEYYVMAAGGMEAIREGK